jgi:hypothetical protein
MSFNSFFNGMQRKYSHDNTKHLSQTIRIKIFLIMVVQIRSEISVLLLHCVSWKNALTMLRLFTRNCCYLSVIGFLRIWFANLVLWEWKIYVSFHEVYLDVCFKCAILKNMKWCWLYWGHGKKSHRLWQRQNSRLYHFFCCVPLQ